MTTSSPLDIEPKRFETVAELHHHIDSFEAYTPTGELKDDWIVPGEKFPFVNGQLVDHKIAHIRDNLGSIAFKGSGAAMQRTIELASLVQGPRDAEYAYRLLESRTPVPDYVEWLDTSPNSLQILRFSLKTPQETKKDTVRLRDVQNRLNQIGR